MNLYFLKFDENFLFLSKLPWKALLMTLLLDNSTKAYKKEAPYIFCHDSCEWKTDLELWGLGGRTGVNVASHYVVFLLLTLNIFHTFF